MNNKYFIISISFVLLLNSCSFNNSSSIISSNNITSISSVDSSISEEINLKTLTINSLNYNKIGSYSTNFESVSLDGNYFFHYRAFDPNDDAFITLVPYTSYVDDGSQEGSFLNTTPIYGIRSLEITYQTKNDNSPLLLLGNSREFEHQIELPHSDDKITKSYPINDFNFFEIDTNNNETKIYSIKLEYTGIKEQYKSSLNGSGTNDYRLNPVHVNEELIPGITTVDVPIEVEYTNKGYNVLKTKTYTYYTYEYIKSNPDEAKKASLIDPIDIAAYYSSFRVQPANYVSKKEYNNAYAYFGDKTRCISTYSRTGGYANSVPWVKQPSSSKPLYHELDIDCEPLYSSSNRGVGRLVVWQYGFSSQGYDDSPVCTYTSDHYKTFQEYLNDGTFGTKFNAESNFTNYKFAPAITKN